MKFSLKLLTVLTMLGLTLSFNPWRGQAAPVQKATAQAVVIGTVRDGTYGGHSFPLYARVVFSIAGGVEASVYSDPFTGQFRANLIQDQTYTVETSAMAPGYFTNITSVNVTANPTVLNIQLSITGDCTSPGYSDNPLLFEPFDGVNPPEMPPGWSEALEAGSSSHWTTATNVYENIPAVSSANAVMFTAAGANSYTQLLSSKNLDLTTRSTASLSFWFYQTDANPNTHDSVQVMISTNDGVTWDLPLGMSIERYSETTGWEFFRFDLSTYAGASKPAVRIGLRAYSGDLDQPINKMLIDNIRVGDGACSQVPGGLIAGYVKDSRAVGIPQARVYRAAAPATDYTYSFTTPADTIVDDGLYLLFSMASGSDAIRVIQSRFITKTQDVTVTADSISRLDFTLNGADFLFNPNAITAEVLGDASTLRTLQIQNYGQYSGAVWLADTSYNLPTIAADAAVSTAHPAASAKDPTAELPAAANSLHEAAQLAARVQTTPSSPLAVTTQFPTSYALPIPGKVRGRSAVASCDGKSFYLFGGQDAPNSYLKESWKFNTTTGSWARKADMPTPVGLMNMNAVCMDTSIYLVGGYSAGWQYEFMLIYNTLTDTWIQTTWPHSQTPMLAAYKGTLYAIGGEPINQETYAYTPSTGWVRKTDLPTAVIFGTAVTVDNYIFVIGGEDETTQPLTNVQRYNPATDTWDTSGPNLPEGRANHSAFWYGDHTIYLLGSGGQASDPWSAWSDGLTYDTTLWPGGAWSRLPSGTISTPVTAAAGICLGEKIWLVGGVDANTKKGNAVVYNTNQILDYGLPCHTSLPAVPWLNLSADNLSLADSGNGQITLNFNGAAVGQPGLYRGLLRIVSDSTAHYQDIPVQMIRVEKGSGLTITPQSGASEGRPKKTVTYTFTITNLSSTPTDFPITITNAHIPGGWSVTILPTSTGTLAQSESKMISVEVTLPGSGVADGTIFPLNLSIGSSGDPVNYGTATFITTYKPYLFLVPGVHR